MKDCNLWRNYYDIDDSWENVTGIINWYGDNQDHIGPSNGPGHWNDPDMVFKHFYYMFGNILIFCIHLEVYNMDVEGVLIIYSSAVLFSCASREN